MFNLNEISKAIVEGNRDVVLELTRAALGANVPAKEILDNGLVPGLMEVGNLFEAGEYFLPELLVSGEAASGAVGLLEPVLSKADTPAAGKYLIGTVQGDVHDVGKNIVIMMLKGNGWQVTDLGVDVSPEEFCSAVGKGDFDILGMSSLLTTTMPDTVKTIETLKTAGLRDKVKIMVGGAPITQEWADKIGADGYAPDASAAVKVAMAIVGKKEGA
ncbi:Methionine synthase [subsurface metagenome]